MAGTTVVDCITFTTFWKQFNIDREKSFAILTPSAKFSRIGGIGAALLILTGVGMMGLTHGVFGEQLWFRIKFALVVILILNALLVGRRQGLKLRIHMANPNAFEEVTKAKAGMYRFYILQFALFLLVIFLSVFKFN